VLMEEVWRLVDSDGDIQTARDAVQIRSFFACTGAQ
jgi:hypothetical protein